jgi:hypothetical protein
MTTDFNPPTTGLFSYAAAASGGTVSANYDSARGYSFAKTDAGSSDRAVFQGKAVPVSTPWTATMRVQMSPALASEYARVGIGLYNSSSGKLLLCGTALNGGVIDLTVMYFTALATYSSSPLSSAILGKIPVWLQVSFDGTTYTFSASFDENITWVTLATMLAATYFTADKIGIAIETFGTATIKPTALITYYHDPDF